MGLVLALHSRGDGDDITGGGYCYGCASFHGGAMVIYWCVKLCARDCRREYPTLRTQNFSLGREVALKMVQASSRTRLGEPLSPKQDCISLNSNLGRAAGADGDGDGANL
ncbi:hypothetical protein DEO72_LG3g1373 [Vigna unguiculata]|uniref:Uncharacterized protein n=1 Tax=Vigna unguiculata TaxID=3917 RepID=A0A4D6LET9_VIGUN|nr:hypothetical protein DEO72_LG3g1373 [Vigna unguiculata]